MVKLSSLRNNAIKLMTESGIEEARADTDVLLSHFAGADKKDIILGNKIIDENQEKLFLDAVNRRISGEPVQYITGKCEFFSLEFFVNSSTLIPRADTEIVVEECIKLIKEHSLKSVLDIGAGSGCIGITLSHSIDDLDVTLLDVSEDALKMCKRNAESLLGGKKISFINADIKAVNEECFEKFDLIVSNPPYIETEVVKELEEKVKDYEPIRALDGGEDGLLFYRVITELASKKAKYLAFEIGYNQKETVFSIMSEYFSDIKIYKDYGNNFRCLIGKNKQI